MKNTTMVGVSTAVMLLTMLWTSPSCTHETLNINQFDTICFQRDILPVFTNGCAMAGCHSVNGEGMTLNSYDGILGGITPGSPQKSRIYQAITAKLIQPMPPDHALAENDRIRIRIWIEQGAGDTRCDSVTAGYPDMKGGLK